MASDQAPQVALERVEALRQAHNTHNVDEIMKFFVEDGLDYSDYGAYEMHPLKELSIHAARQASTLFTCQLLQCATSSKAFTTVL